MKLTIEAADWAGARSDAAIKALPADMVVDYVKVWSSKPEKLREVIIWQT